MTTWTTRPGLTGDLYDLKGYDNSDVLDFMEDGDGDQIRVHADPAYPLSTQWSVRPSI